MTVRPLGLSLLLALASASAFGQTPNTPAAPNQYATPPASPSGMTAGQQPSNSADVDMASRIRQRLMADKSLSTAAQNVTVVASGGNVTLRGVVQTDAEKTAVTQIAADVAGSGRVSEELRVATSRH